MERQLYWKKRTEFPSQSLKPPSVRQHAPIQTSECSATTFELMTFRCRRCCCHPRAPCKTNRWKSSIWSPNNLSTNRDCNSDLFHEQLYDPRAWRREASGAAAAPAVHETQWWSRVWASSWLWPCGVNTCSYLFMNSSSNMILQITIINWYHVHPASSIFQKSLLCLGFFDPFLGIWTRSASPRAAFCRSYWWEVNLPFGLECSFKTHRYKPLNPHSTYQPTVDQPMHKFFIVFHFFATFTFRFRACAKENCGEQPLQFARSTDVSIATGV